MFGIRSYLEAERNCDTMDTMMRLDKEVLLREDFDKTVGVLAEKLDFWDVQILRKFYMTGKEFPLDTQPYCFPILYTELKQAHRLKIGIEAFRKRLRNLVKTGFLEKIPKTNPTNYEPVSGKENVVRAIIMKFFMMHGLKASLQM